MVQPTYTVPRILLVDDDEELLRLHSMSFEDYGFEVLAVKSCKEAVSQAKLFAPELVVLDMRLDEVSGLEALESIRAVCRDIVPEPCFFALTGWSSPQGKAQALKAGFAEYFVKPVSIKNVVDAYRARTQNRAARA